MERCGGVQEDGCVLDFGLLFLSLRPFASWVATVVQTVAFLDNIYFFVDFFNPTRIFVELGPFPGFFVRRLLVLTVRKFSELYARRLIPLSGTGVDVLRNWR